MTSSKLSRSAVPGVWSVYAATAAVAACLSTASVPAQAEIIVRGIEGKPLHEARPAPAFLKPDVNIIVAQPAPSDFNPSFLGPVLLMRQLFFADVKREHRGIEDDAAIQRGYRSRMTDAIHIEDMASKGFIKSIDDGTLRAVGFIVNCPVVYRV